MVISASLIRRFVRRTPRGAVLITVPLGLAPDKNWAWNSGSAIDGLVSQRPTTTGPSRSRPPEHLHRRTAQASDGSGRSSLRAADARELTMTPARRRLRIWDLRQQEASSTPPVSTDQKGLDTAWTADEFQTALEKGLTAKDSEGLSTSRRTTAARVADLRFPAHRQFDRQRGGEKGKADGNLNNPAVVAALQQFAGWRSFVDPNSDNKAFTEKRSHCVGSATGSTPATRRHWATTWSRCRFPTSAAVPEAARGHGPGVSAAPARTVRRREVPRLSMTPT